MEKGRVASFNESSSTGTITDDNGRALGFSNSSCVGRDRSSLKIGEMVWFERIGLNADAKAINVRRS